MCGILKIAVMSACDFVMIPLHFGQNAVMAKLSETFMWGQRHIERNRLTAFWWHHLFCLLQELRLKRYSLWILKKKERWLSQVSVDRELVFDRAEDWCVSTWYSISGVISEAMSVVSCSIQRENERAPSSVSLLLLHPSWTSRKAHHQKNTRYTLDPYQNTKSF